MKCISLWQPWATLMVIGAKRNETRHWGTSYRGVLGIHAAKYWPKENQELCREEPFRSALAKAGQLPLGALIGTVELVMCVPTEVFSGFTPVKIEEPELSFGDYSPGRFAWLNGNPVQFTLPIAYRGSQGFFEVPDSLLLPEGRLEARHCR